MSFPHPSIRYNLREVPVHGLGGKAHTMLAQCILEDFIGFLAIAGTRTTT